MSGSFILTAVVWLLQPASAERAQPALHGERRYLAWGFPLGLCLFSWILLRTMTLNLYQGGIVWRGTFYPLDQLRRNRI